MISDVLMRQNCPADIVTSILWLISQTCGRNFGLLVLIWNEPVLQHYIASTYLFLFWGLSEVVRYWPNALIVLCFHVRPWDVILYYWCLFGMKRNFKSIWHLHISAYSGLWLTLSGATKILKELLLTELPNLPGLTCKMTQLQLIGYSNQFDMLNLPVMIDRFHVVIQ